MSRRHDHEPVVLRSGFQDWRIRVDSDGAVAFEIPGNGKDGWVVVKRLSKDGVWL